jgi:hypothetical protein
MINQPLQNHFELLAFALQNNQANQLLAHSLKHSPKTDAAPPYSQTFQQ